MNIREIRQSDAVFLDAADIAEVLGCDPQTLRVQARKNPSALGFPVCVTGIRCRFPRKPFLDFIDGQLMGRREY